MTTARPLDGEEAWPGQAIADGAARGILTRLVDPATTDRMVSLVVALEEIASRSPAAAVVLATQAVIVEALHRPGTFDSLRDACGRISRGEHIGALVASGFTAVRAGNGAQVTGSHALVELTPRCDAILVLAPLDGGGLATFLVPGASVVTGRAETRVGLRAIGVSDLTLGGAPAEVVSTDEAVARRALDGQRLGRAATAVGLGRAALERALDCARNEPALAREQRVRFALAEAATEIEAARSLVLRAAKVRDAGRTFTADSAESFLVAARAARHAAERALEISSTRGLTNTLEIERIWRDARVLGSHEGSTDDPVTIVANEILKEP